MDEKQALLRIVDALEDIARELAKLNHEGVTVWGGSTMEEN